jgi:hypothetical protein
MPPQYICAVFAPVQKNTPRLNWLITYLLFDGAGNHPESGGAQKTNKVFEEGWPPEWSPGWGRIHSKHISAFLVSCPITGGRNVSLQESMKTMGNQ